MNKFQKNFTSIKMWLFYSLITLSISIFSMNSIKSYLLVSFNQKLNLISCRNIRLELINLPVVNYSKISSLYYFLKADAKL